MRLFPESVGQYRSTWYETARNLFRSRNTQRARADRLAEQNQELKLQTEQLVAQLREAEERQDQAQQRIHQQQQEIEELRRQPVKLPSDLPLPHHSFGPKMISLCLNLCKEIGFRPAETALRIIFDWMGAKADIPSFDAIRVWACRVGVAQLQSPIEGEDWTWLVDHSNQIGQEKVLQIIGIRVKDLPPLGETLPLEKMHVLATIPGTSWTRDDVRREYKTLAERIGPPKYLLSDGAVELRESADVLEVKGKTPVVLRDMKHYAANVFERLIGKDERFQEYLINRHGVYRGVAAKLKTELDCVRAEHPPGCELSATMASKLIAFVADSAAQLGEGDRAWLSTENLESLFGRYKRLEGQHSKGGFTSLLAAMPMLLTNWTPARVRESLTKVSVKAMRTWVQDTLGTTLTSRRVTAYQESAAASYG